MFLNSFIPYRKYTIRKCRPPNIFETIFLLIVRYLTSFDKRNDNTTDNDAANACPTYQIGESVTDRDQLLIVTEQGQIIRMTSGDLRPIGRDTQGVRLIDLAEGDRVVSIAALTEPDDVEELESL